MEHTGLAGLYDQNVPLFCWGMMNNGSKSCKGESIHLMNNEKQWEGHLFSILCVIAWGTSFLVSKSLMEKLTPVQLMLLRFAIAWLAIWIIYPKWYFNWREEGQFVVLSLVGNTLYYLAENTALRMTLASNVSILVSAAPIASALMLRLFERDERLSGRQVAGIGIAFFGVLFVVFNGVFVLKLNPLGDLLAVAAAFCWALYGFLAKRIMDRYDTFLSTRKLMFYGIITTAPLLLFEKNSVKSMGLLNLHDILGLLYLGLICSALCYLLWNVAIAQIGAMKANLYVYAVPVVTMMASGAFLGEAITWGGAIGVVLVVGGMLLSSINGRHSNDRDMAHTV